MRARLRFGTSVIVLAALALLSGPGSAAAGFINYSVGSSNFSFQADTVTNNPLSATIIFVPDGGSVVGTLQTGVFRIGFSSFVGSSPFTLTETFTANSVASTVQLSGTLSINALDSLTFTNLTPTVLTLAGGQTLTVTPLPLGPITNPNGGNTPYTLQATFALSAAPTPVPEPSSLLLLGSGVVCLAGWRLRKKRAA